MTEQTCETGVAFRQRVDDTVRHGCVTMGLAIGVELGLFDTMATLDKPFTLQQLADLSNTKESSLQPWLLMMSSADIVKMTDTAGKEFFLPPERREALTSPFSSTVSSAKYVVAFTSCVMDVANSFKKDPTPTSGPSNVSQLFVLWQTDRRRVLTSLMPRVIEQIPSVSSTLDNGGTVLDVGCNKGDLAFVIAKLFPKATIVGIDPSQEAIDKAKQHAADNNVTNVTFDVGDAMCMPSDWSNRFDYVITINSMHHFPDPLKGAREMHRVMATTGSTSVVEIRNDHDLQANLKHPSSTMYYAFHMTVSSMHSDPGHGDKSEADQNEPDKKPDEGFGLPDCQTYVKTLHAGGYQAVEIKELPQADFVDQVHIVATK